jgi:predicted transposase YdaD
MPKPYDVTTKELMAPDPPSWMNYLGLRADEPIQVLSADVATTAAEADQVYRIGGSRPSLVHTEMQHRWDATLPRRLWRYNALLDLKYDLRVRSVVVLLRPRADCATLTGVLDLRHPDGPRIVEFHYHVVRAWEQPVEPLLAGPLATLPMACLADVSVADLPQVLERIDTRLIAETPPAEAARMMAQTLTLTGIRLEPDQIDAFARRLRSMNLLRESSFYEMILREGRKEGRKEGREEGREEGRKEGEKKGELREAQKLVIQLGQGRFGRVDKATRAAIEAIDNLDRLERLFQRVQAVSGWAELLAETK